MFIAAAIVSRLLAAALVASDAGKLAKDPKQLMIMETVGFPKDMMWLLAVAEIAGAPGLLARPVLVADRCRRGNRGDPLLHRCDRLTTSASRNDSTPRWSCSWSPGRIGPPRLDNLKSLLLQTPSGVFAQTVWQFLPDEGK
jgi:hypothetical protein